MTSPGGSDSLASVVLESSGMLPPLVCGDRIPLLATALSLGWSIGLVPAGARTTGVVTTGGGISSATTGLAHWVVFVMWLMYTTRPPASFASHPAVQPARKQAR